MSFRDEINEVIKTPEQVKDEKIKNSVNTGISYAKEDYTNIKNEIKRKAQCGNYEQVGNRRIIKFDYTCCNAYKMANIVAEWFDGIINRGIRCEVQDVVAFEAYKKELQRLTKEDEIDIQLYYLFRDDDGSESKFELPGNYSSVHKRTTCHIIRRSNYVLRCICEF